MVLFLGPSDVECVTHGFFVRDEGVSCDLCMLASTSTKWQMNWCQLVVDIKE